MEASRLQHGRHAAALCEWAGAARPAGAPGSLPARRWPACCRSRLGRVPAVSASKPFHLNRRLLSPPPFLCPADNWAVALTDIARLVRGQQPDEAFECLSAAAHKYALSLAVHSDNPQARAGRLWVLLSIAEPACRACQPAGAAAAACARLASAATVPRRCAGAGAATASARHCGQVSRQLSLCSRTAVPSAGPQQLGARPARHLRPAPALGARRLPAPQPEQVPARHPAAPRL